MAEPVKGMTFKQRFAARLERSHFIRFHMTLILTATMLTGMLCSKLLLWSGIRTMALRYAIAVIVSYLAFFLFVKLWLLYIGTGGSGGAAGRSSGNYSWNVDLPVGRSVSGGDQTTPFHGFAEGSSGGGGAGGSFMETDTAAAVPVEAGTKVATGVGEETGNAVGEVLGGVDEKSLGLIAAALLIVFSLSAVAGSVYLVWCAPDILAEAAFQVLLVAGFNGKVRRAEQTGWEISIFRATWWIFLLVLIFSIAFGVAAHKYNPQAATIKDLFTTHGSIKD